MESPPRMEGCRREDLCVNIDRKTVFVVLINEDVFNILETTLTGSSMERFRSEIVNFDVSLPGWSAMKSSMLRRWQKIVQRDVDWISSTLVLTLPGWLAKNSPGFRILVDDVKILRRDDDQRSSTLVVTLSGWPMAVPQCQSDDYQATTAPWSSPRPSNLFCEKESLRRNINVQAMYSHFWKSRLAQ